MDSKEFSKAIDVGQESFAILFFIVFAILLIACPAVLIVAHFNLITVQKDILGVVIGISVLEIIGGGYLLIEFNEIALELLFLAVGLTVLKFKKIFKIA